MPSWGSPYGASIEVRRRIDGAQGQRFVFSVQSVGVRHRKSIVARRDVRSPPCSSLLSAKLEAGCQQTPGRCAGWSSRTVASLSRLKWAREIRVMLVGLYVYNINDIRIMSIMSSRGGVPANPRDV